MDCGGRAGVGIPPFLGVGERRGAWGVISVWVAAPYDLPVWATHNMTSSPFRGGMSYGEITTTSVIFVFVVTDRKGSTAIDL